MHVLSEPLFLSVQELTMDGLSLVIIFVAIESHKTRFGVDNLGHLK